MIKLDNDLLVDLGLGDLPLTHRSVVLRALYEELEQRVGRTIAKDMTNMQLDEFEQYIKNKDESGALEWLDRNFPGYRDTVREEFDKLRNEVRLSKTEISALSVLYEPDGSV